MNHRLLETWDDKLILFCIIDTMVYCNFDQHKQQGYATDLCDRVSKTILTLL